MTIDRALAESSAIRTALTVHGDRLAATARRTNVSFLHASDEGGGIGTFEGPLIRAMDLSDEGR